MGLEKYSDQKIAEKIIDLMGDLFSIRLAVTELINSKEADITEILETRLEEFDRNSAALRNAIVTLGKTVAGDAEEDGELEVDVVPDENGLRF